MPGDGDIDWSLDEWWKRHERGEEFGIPHPGKMQMLVDEICATRLREAVDDSP